MERVQFQQEQMLEELKDLVDKKIFTKQEIKHVIKRRTTFETALVRRVAKKADFLRYASYEMSLEQLRKKRVERMESEHASPTISDYALVRRQFHIFERALKKFKSDVGLWIQYIQVAKREGARALVGRITARALQLHPNKPSLYILAASHELDNLSPSTARTLLQRGIRLNPESVEMWREYVRMELSFIEGLRRRWDVLGIHAGDKGKEVFRDGNNTEGLDMNGGEAVEGAASRLEVMQGAIVKSVVTSAVQALPKIELFESLKSLIVEYPCQATLQQTLLDLLYDLLKGTLPHDARAIRLLADRFLSPGLQGEAFVEGLRRANEVMTQDIGEDSGDDIEQAYATFVEEWCRASIDDNLKHYLVSCMRILIAKQRKASGILMSSHIRLLVQLCDTHPENPAKILRTARKYTIKAPKSAQVWYERLVVEKQFGRTIEEAEKVWSEARGSIEGSEEEIEKIWRWGLLEEPCETKRLAKYAVVLKESMGIRMVHEILLMGYVEEWAQPNTGQLISDQENKSARWLDSICHMDGAYLTTGRVWQKVFKTMEESEVEDEEKKQILGIVYEKWRRMEEKEARKEWRRWLVENGKGKEASAIRPITFED